MSAWIEPKLSVIRNMATRASELESKSFIFSTSKQSANSCFSDSKRLRAGTSTCACAPVAERRFRTVFVNGIQSANWAEQSAPLSHSDFDRSSQNRTGLRPEHRRKRKATLHFFQDSNRIFALRAFQLMDSLRVVNNAGQARPERSQKPDVYSTRCGKEDADSAAMWALACRPHGEGDSAVRKDRPRRRKG